MLSVLVSVDRKGSGHPHRPGGVVILSSQSQKRPSQYVCACGMWNTSS